MTEDAKKYFQELKNCQDKKCGCPIGDMMEAQVAEFASRMSHVNATATEQFQLQVNAQNSLLMRAQAELFLSGGVPPVPPS